MYRCVLSSIKWLNCEQNWERSPATPTGRWREWERRWRKKKRDGWGRKMGQMTSDLTPPSPLWVLLTSAVPPPAWWGRSPGSRCARYGSSSAQADNRETTSLQLVLGSVLVDVFIFRYVFIDKACVCVLYVNGERVCVCVEWECECLTSLILISFSSSSTCCSKCWHRERYSSTCKHTHTQLSYQTTMVLTFELLTSGTSSKHLHCVSIWQSQILWNTAVQLCEFLQGRFSATLFFTL